MIPKQVPTSSASIPTNGTQSMPLLAATMQPNLMPHLPPQVPPPQQQPSPHPFSYALSYPNQQGNHTNVQSPVAPQAWGSIPTQFPGQVHSAVDLPQGSGSFSPIQPAAPYHMQSFQQGLSVPSLTTTPVSQMMVPPGLHHQQQQGPQPQVPSQRIHHAFHPQTQQPQPLQHTQQPQMPMQIQQARSIAQGSFPTANNTQHMLGQGYPSNGSGLVADSPYGQGSFQTNNARGVVRALPANPVGQPYYSQFQRLAAATPFPTGNTSSSPGLIPTQGSIAVPVVATTLPPSTPSFNFSSQAPSSQQSFQQQLSVSKPRPPSFATTHAPMSVRPSNYRCVVCGNEFASLVEMNVHSKVSHTGIHERIQSLIAAARSHKTAPFQCRLCLEEFSDKESCIEHEGLFHSVPCLHCELTFLSLPNMHSHRLIHYKCPLCMKQFPKPVGFVKHMRVHTGEQPWKCDICGRRFNDKGNFMRHKKIHTGKREFVCNVCGRAFFRSDNLETHKLHHIKHSARPTSSDRSESRNDNNYSSGSDTSSTPRTPGVASTLTVGLTAASDPNTMSSNDSSLAEPSAPSSSNSSRTTSRAMNNTDLKSMLPNSMDAITSESSSPSDSS